MKFEVQPIHGWGWSPSAEMRAEMYAPFILTASVAEYDGFTVALGKLDQETHAFAGKWIVISPIQAVAGWDLSHVCVFPDEPSIPDTLESLVVSSPMAGFARVVQGSS